MNYFAYGSNMSLARLCQRVFDAQMLGVYTLERHDLRFHKVGVDGSGKCDAYETGNGDDTVYGVLFSINAAGKAILDAVEGLGFGYNDKQVTVYDNGGNAQTAFTYYATKIDDVLRPYSWYKRHLLVGAEHANLPSRYVSRIELVTAIADPDSDREARELAIYG